MKKYIYLLAVAAITIMGAAACSESKLQQKVDEANQECPKEMGLLGEITSVTLEEGNVVFTYTVNEDYINIEALNNADPEMMKRNALLVFRHPTKDFEDLLVAIEEEQAGLVINFTGSETGNVFSITLCSDDLLAAANSTEEKDYNAALLGHAEFINAQCPMALEPGVTLADVSVTEGYLVYHCVIDSVYSIQELNATNEQARPEIINSLNGSDPVKEIVLILCERAEKGIAIRYTATDTEEECVIAIPVDELRGEGMEMPEPEEGEEEADTLEVEE